MDALHIKIAELSLKHYQELPKTGKPKENEWTVLSTITKQNSSNIEVVALGTGSKCIGKTKMCPQGSVINDSHAEVMCRRAFLQYLYSEMTNSSEIFSFNKTSSKFSLKSDIKFHFFTTHVLCGDAAIFPKQNMEDFGIQIDNEDSQTYEVPVKKLKTDIFRTGAKCLKNDARQDPKGIGTEYHTVGVVRTKPGRGDPTSSVSCSDKMAKWCHLGIQGALIMLLVDAPIYLSSFTILKNTPFCPKALERALYGRLNGEALIPPYQKHLLEIFHVDLKFPYSKSDDKQASFTSIAWYKANSKSVLEVSVNGRKQGVTKKNLTSKKGRLKICKFELFQKFTDKITELNITFEDVTSEKLTYLETKHLSKLYYDNWKIFRDKIGSWTHKDPKFLEFTLS